MLCHRKTKKIVSNRTNVFGDIYICMYIYTHMHLCIKFKMLRYKLLIH